MNPTFSVIVPTYNRPRQLAACLEAMAALNYPRERWELLIADDGSPQPAREAVAAVARRINVRLLELPRGGPAATRNAGAAAAQNEFLAFTDDDCAPRPDWLRAMAAQLSRTPNALVGGAVANALPQNLCSEASQQLVSYLYDYYNAPAPRFFASNNIALARDRFAALGGFDTSYPRAAAEDRDFCDRWIATGAPLVYAPGALIDHAHALTLRRFWRQHWNYGRGAYRFHLSRARREREPVKVESLRFYARLVAYPLRHGPRPRTFLLAGLMGLSQAANIAGYLAERLAPAPTPQAGLQP